MKRYTEEHMRKFILSDEGLYLQAREFGGGGDEEMYAALPNFIRKNRKMIAEYMERAGV